LNNSTQRYHNASNTIQEITGSERQPSAFPRISSQHLEAFALPQSLFRSLNALGVNDAQAPSTNGLKPLPSNLRKRHATASAFAFLLLKPLPNDVRTLFLETLGTDPSAAIPLRGI